MKAQRTGTACATLLLAAWGVLSCAQPVLAAMAWASLEAARSAAEAVVKDYGGGDEESDDQSPQPCVGTVVVCDVCVQNPRTALPPALPSGLFRTHEECELQGARPHGPDCAVDGVAPDLTSDWGQEAHWPCGPPPAVDVSSR